MADNEGYGLIILVTQHKTDLHDFTDIIKKVHMSYADIDLTIVRGLKYLTTPLSALELHTLGRYQRYDR